MRWLESRREELRAVRPYERGRGKRAFDAARHYSFVKALGVAAILAVLAYVIRWIVSGEKDVTGLLTALAALMLVYVAVFVWNWAKDPAIEIATKTQMIQRLGEDAQRARREAGEATDRASELQARISLRNDLARLRTRGEALRAKYAATPEPTGPDEARRLKAVMASSFSMQDWSGEAQRLLENAGLEAEAEAFDSRWSANWYAELAAEAERRVAFLDDLLDPERQLWKL
jgi:hypothetical protein